MQEKDRPIPSSLGLRGSGDRKNGNLQTKLKKSFDEQGY